MAKKAEAKETTEQPQAPAEGTAETGIEALQGKDIDQRMAELLEDHKRMGAR